MAMKSLRCTTDLGWRNWVLALSKAWHVLYNVDKMMNLGCQIRVLGISSYGSTKPCRFIANTTLFPYRFTALMAATPSAEEVVSRYPTSTWLQPDQRHPWNKFSCGINITALRVTYRRSWCMSEYAMGRRGLDSWHFVDTVIHQGLCAPANGPPCN